LGFYWAHKKTAPAAVIAKEISESELRTRCDEGVIWLMQGWAYGTIRKLSYAAGHHHLADTYDSILNDHGGNTAVRLVDLAIKLEHFATVPEYEITRLRDKVTRNVFSYTLLRQLIGDFLYLYRVDTRTLQKLGAMFEIAATGPKFLLPDNKKSLPDRN
jgi:hypothetical protein